LGNVGAAAAASANLFGGRFFFYLFSKQKIRIDGVHRRLFEQLQRVILRHLTHGIPAFFNKLTLSFSLSPLSTCYSLSLSLSLTLSLSLSHHPSQP
jgi:Na+-driven multidrug efflux pump